MDGTSGPLAGIRFLVIEDEIMQAMLLGEMLTEMGGIVSETAYAFDQARGAIYKDAFDCAVPDINLSGTLSFPIAETLKVRGIPFVFCTAFSQGVDVFPSASEIATVDKPVQPEELLEAVLEALERRKS